MDIRGSVSAAGEKSKRNVHAELGFGRVYLCEIAISKASKYQRYRLGVETGSARADWASDLLGL